MLDELYAIHQEVMSTTPLTAKRYLYEKINWETKAICLLGGRGVGKTTLMCQYLLEHYQTVNNALYISADNIYVLSTGLFAIAQEYFKYGGKALFIDEVHKYPEWEREIKNILDTYRRHQVIFSGSSSLDLRKSKYDLSRRVIYYELKGLSFREYFNFSTEHSFPALSLTDILTQHTAHADQFKGLTVLKYFKQYLTSGYFPFFLEGESEYLSRIANIVEKVIYEDIAVIYNLRQPTLPILKKLLWLVATSKELMVNIERISQNIQVSREITYQCLEYLDQAGLLKNLFPLARGMKLIRKPSKIYLENTNLLYALNGNLSLESDIGSVRETFFANQVSTMHHFNLHEQGDFLIDEKFVVEVGGKSKDFRQIKSVSDAYLAIDNIEIGQGKRIPLYLFGFLY